MGVFGYPLETVYLAVLIVSGSLTLLYIFFSDVVDGVFELPDHPLFSPQLVLSFFTVGSASGFLLERYTELPAWLIAAMSGGIALIIVLLLHFFVFIPLRSAETSLNYSDADLEGALAKVIVTVPRDGFGEILLQRKSGAISKAAKSMNNEEIAFGTEVIIVKMENGVALVAKHDPYDIPSLHKGGYME
jgi:hypothetical protein